MIRAAGILLVSTKGNALFLKRGPGGDAPGLWCVPGGRVEEGELTIDAAVRETEEETGGFKAKAKDLKAWSRTVTPRETTGAIPTPPPSVADSASDDWWRKYHDALQYQISLPAERQHEMALKVKLLRQKWQEALKRGDAEWDKLSTELVNDLTASVAVVPGEQVEFTTFVLKDVEEFIPDVAKSGEHVGYAWAPLSQPPEPLHPGVRLSLSKFGMDERHIAEAMARSEFASPQRYENLWLFAIRITGTGMAYRRAHDEFVWRDGTLYLNQHFLDRCAGLPVIWEHPAGNVLNAKEYRDRSIGAIMMAYIVPDPEGRGNDEVWAIARINDTEAAEEMDKGSSTSPAVVWRDADANNVMEIDGNNFLIEGKPSLLDHIAICPLGVWDKGGRPSGVATTATARGDSDMTKEDLEAMLRDEAKKRADENALRDTSMAALAASLKSVADTLGAVKARFDSDDEKKRSDASKRRDSFKFGKRADGEDDDKFKERRDSEEKEMADACMEAGDSEEDAKKKAADARKDAEKDEAEEAEREKADKARKDAEEAAKEKDKEARGDSVKLTALEKQLAELRGQIQPMAADEANRTAQVQARADSVEMSFGRRARPRMVGESLLSYRKHFVDEFKQYDPRYKDKDLTAVAADDAMFSIVEGDVYKAAEAEARSPARGAPGTLTMVTKRGDSGHVFNEFHGSTKPWMDRFAGPVRQYARRFRDRDEKRN